MAIILEDKVREKDRITQLSFLSSVKEWYPDGVHLGVERVTAKDVDGKYGKQCLFIINCSILDVMEKCRARVLDEQGQPVEMKDMMGQTVEKIEIVDDADAVTFFIYVGYNDEGTYLIASKYSAIHKFIAPILYDAGVIEDTSKGVGFEVQELLDSLEGYEFICQCGQNKSKKLIPVVKSL